MHNALYIYSVVTEIRPSMLITPRARMRSRGGLRVHLSVVAQKSPDIEI
jgi:hypothetical protein